MSVLGWAQSFPSLRTSAIKRCSRHGTRLRCSIESFHVPVLIDQVLELYEGRRFEVFVDGTIGAGGHASKLLSSCDIDLFIGLDQDEIALAIASERLSKYGDKVKLVQSSFRDLEKVLSQFAVAQGEVDGILLDIGVSSMQIDTADRGMHGTLLKSQLLPCSSLRSNVLGRLNQAEHCPRNEGFSFISDGPLDMRMNRKDGLNAAEVVNNFAVEELTRIFLEYGEDPQSRRLAKSVSGA
mmetsp:Transcript_10173/g.42648  ORF Transcript_10173/g.42648 Transcript_10173/m.42648 type:complete len:239 (-) Transcript_10173:1381-2097(-)